MNASASRSPAASIIIPSYGSQDTVAGTIESLRGQTCKDFETILVDSSNDDGVARIVSAFPEVRYYRSPQRLLPHAARNLGVEHAQSDILVFTDPDVVAAPDWLERLLNTHHVTRGPVIGAIASLQQGWLETGIHIAKFDLWLPGGRQRSVPVGATANFLCPMQLFIQAGRFDGREMIGDTLLSWELVRLGQTLHFAPDAIVYHDHRSTFRELLRERFVRGADFARLRMNRAEWKPAHTIVTLVASILPLRLAKLVARSFACGRRARCVGDCLRTVPIITGGHAAWLMGEISQYWRRLLPSWRSGGRRRARRNARS
jgi:glycosyltransferase involved in cell wall biosynthesis